MRKKEKLFVGDFGVTQCIFSPVERPQFPTSEKECVTFHPKMRHTLLGRQCKMAQSCCTSCDSSFGSIKYKCNFKDLLDAAETIAERNSSFYSFFFSRKYQPASSTTSNILFLCSSPKFILLVFPVNQTHFPPFFYLYYKNKHLAFLKRK